MHEGTGPRQRLRLPQARIRIWEMVARKSDVASSNTGGSYGVCSFVALDVFVPENPASLPNSPASFPERQMFVLLQP